MKVITLDDVEFEQACVSLALKIVDEDDVIVLVGVRTGGAVVARLVYECLVKKNTELKYYEVSASRGATATKNTSGVRKVFKFFPRIMLDYMRILEHWLVGLRMSFFRDVYRSVQYDKALIDYLKSLNSGTLYLIDDAIDSGSTVNKLIEELNSINSNVNIKVAVLVVTQNNPLVLPDASLYKNVLLRFPWSNDF